MSPMLWGRTLAVIRRDDNLDAIFQPVWLLHAAELTPLVMTLAIFPPNHSTTALAQISGTLTDMLGCKRNTGRKGRRRWPVIWFEMDTSDTHQVKTVST